LGEIEGTNALIFLVGENGLAIAIIAVHKSTTIAETVKMMKDKHLLNLPVEKDGEVAYSVTRHDVLRVRIGLGPGIEG
jgi:hypothetical protein